MRTRGGYCNIFMGSLFPDAALTRLPIVRTYSYLANECSAVHYSCRRRRRRSCRCCCSRCCCRYLRLGSDRVLWLFRWRSWISLFRTEEESSSGSFGVSVESRRRPTELTRKPGGRDGGRNRRPCVVRGWRSPDRIRSSSAAELDRRTKKTNPDGWNPRSPGTKNNYCAWISWQGRREALSSGSENN